MRQGANAINENRRSDIDFAAYAAVAELLRQARNVLL